MSDVKPNLFIPELFLAVIIITASACRKDRHPVQQADKWETVPTPDYGKPIDMEFVNTDTGYIVGQNNNLPIHNILIKTVNGGKSWKTISLSSQFLHDTSSGAIGGIYVSPFNANILFATGQNLIRSVDGGYHWSIVQTNNNIPPAAMHFFNLQNGVASSSSSIYTTVDSGLTWRQASYPETGSGIGCVSFSDNETGFAVTSREIEGSNGYYSIPVILKTTDEGDTWRVVFTLNYPFNGILDMDFVNDTLGYLVKTYGTVNANFPGDAQLLKTTDGGKNWLIINNDIPPGKETIHFISELKGFLFVGRVYHTNDGGKTWVKIDGPLVDQYCFANDHLLYAIDGHGNLLKRKF